MEYSIPLKTLNIYQVIAFSILFSQYNISNKLVNERLIYQLDNLNQNDFNHVELIIEKFILKSA